MFNIEKILSVITIVFCLVAITVMLFGLRAEIVIAAVSGIIALIALRANIQAGKETRKHNRLMVKPLLRFDVAIGDGDNLRRYRLKLINYGFGPAIITDVKLFFDDELVPITKGKGTIPFILKIIKNLDNQKTRGISQGDVLVAGGEIILFDVQSNVQDKNLNDLYKIELLIRYESFYGEKLPLLHHKKIIDEKSK